MLPYLAVVALVIVVAAVMLYIANEVNDNFQFCGPSCVQFIYVRFAALMTILLIACLLVRFWLGVWTLVIIYGIVTIFFGVYLAVVGTGPVVPPIDPIDSKTD